MKARTKTHLISRERAIEIAMAHNCVTREIASNYTDSELKEVLHHMSCGTVRFKANF